MTAAYRKIGLIGRINSQETFFDGQTVKTRTLYRMMEGRYGHEAVCCVDTSNYRAEAFRVGLELFRCLQRCDDIVVSLSSGGRKVLFPAISRVARRRGVRVYHVLIGGRLAENVRQDSTGKLVSHLNSFEVNWVETKKLVEDLAELGVHNAEFLPNFKQLEPVKLDKTPYVRSEPVRFCTFSRVRKEKGIENVIKSIAAINAENDGVVAMLDIYGPVTDGYQNRLDELLNTSMAVRYCGCASAEESVETIKGYDALLFPTEWHAEGVPGTVIDALCAGLPVIASRWPYYSEMLEDGVTGLSYEFGHPERLKKTIEAFMSLPDQDVDAMKRECVRRAGAYSAETCFEKMAERIECGQ